MRVGLICSIAAGVLAGLCAAVSGVTIAEISDLRTGDLEAVGFTLNKDAEVDIEVVGLRPYRSRSLCAYAWIIDSETRKPVWEMSRRESDRVDGSKVLRRQEEVESLPAGSYELYYVVREAGFWYRRDRNFFDVIGSLFDDEDDYRIRRRDVDRCYVSICSDEVRAGDFDTFEPDGGFPDALIRHNGLGDEEFIKTAFELSRPLSLRIYALVELPESYRTPVDHAWIIDNDSRDRVWEVEKRDVDDAGGGEKNQVHDDEVTR
jgi:hypothetical protein